MVYNTEDVITMNQKMLMEERDNEAEAIHQLILEAEEKQVYIDAKEVHIYHTYIHAYV